jgi:hypothetical protein
MLARNAIEHEGWTLPPVTYSANEGGVEPTEPLVRERPVTELVAQTLDRLTCFIEEVTVHRLQHMMPFGATVAEIRRQGRLEEAPERFRVTVTPGGLPPWALT